MDRKVTNASTLKNNPYKEFIVLFRHVAQAN